MKHLIYILLAVSILGSWCSRADGIVVDKVYHPYVLPNETEFEWRLLSRQTDFGNLLGQRVAFGKSLNERITLEAYLIGEKTATESFGLQAYELELRWMLSEQGELWADWGVLFEIEKSHEHNNWELTSGILFEKEIGNTSLTINAFTVYEWGETIEAELETEFRVKYRYRFMPEIQPAIELYSGEDFVGIGPAFMGIVRIDRQKQLKWEAGFISEISHSGKDHSLRFALEYEF